MRTRHEVDDAVKAVRVREGLWARVMERNRVATLPHVLGRCESEGNLRNLDIAAGRIKGEYVGGADRDSNLFKTLEGASYCLAIHPDPALDSLVDWIIEKVAAAQEPSGYFQSHFTATKPDEKYKDLARSHEIYCAGHLIEAAVAHHQATGKRNLLNVAIRLADHLDRTFGWGKFETADGHQEVELALVRLYKVTNEKRYLDLCRFFVDIRGDRARVQREYSGKPVIESERHPGRNRPPEYRQDHLPTVEQREPTGHAVRAGYFYASVADLAMEQASPPHALAAQTLWDNIVAKHLYLTGGVGTHQNRDEGFGDPYRLPNDSAYCETCGGIALLLFSHRMSQLRIDSRYADLIETLLHNHLLGSTSLDGCLFNYRNPLASDGSRQRHPWANPACCPTNIVRIIPQLGRFIYSLGDAALYVEQFIASDATMELASGRLRVQQETAYPWDGRVTIDLQPDSPCDFSLHIRIPAWVDGRVAPGGIYRADPTGGTVIRVNGESVDTTRRTCGYCAIHRTWRPGDRVTIEFPMPVQRVLADERVVDDRGRVALMRGPVVYCLEGVDHAKDLNEIALAADASLLAEHRPEHLGGVTVVRERGGPVSAIPYYAWNNRQPGKMLVWIPVGGVV